MKITRFLGALGVAFLCGMGSVLAADTCQVTEYAVVGQSPGGAIQIAQEPSLAVQNSADFTSSPWQSNAFNAATNFILVSCNQQSSYVIGTNPTATNSGTIVFGSQPWVVGVPVNQGFKISFTHNP